MPRRASTASQALQDLELALLIAAAFSASGSSARNRGPSVSPGTRRCTQCRREVPIEQKLLTCDSCREKKRQQKARAKERKEIAALIVEGGEAGKAASSAVKAKAPESGNKNAMSRASYTAMLQAVCDASMEKFENEKKAKASTSKVTGSKRKRNDENASEKKRKTEPTAGPSSTNLLESEPAITTSGVTADDRRALMPLPTTAPSNGNSASVSPKSTPKQGTLTGWFAQG